MSIKCSSINYYYIVVSHSPPHTSYSQTTTTCCDACITEGANATY